ncbi:hypothetical protein A5482_012340 [Cyanobacterium sp. IPPAS B-1200]|uniref:hypothetical protein n=1 Tax=Cyanobacterium sp. IPPAS B-1200 TaxID=1562720 RepID=UPI001372F292|nr:hypothetical protein [Cyanobacterium sp. IPPAS B-1200]
MNNNEKLTENHQRIVSILDKTVKALQEQDKELAYLRSELFKLRLQVSELTEFRNKMLR